VCFSLVLDRQAETRTFGQRMIRVLQQRREPFAKRDDMLPVGAGVNVQGEQASETPHIPAFRSIPRVIGPVLCQLFEVVDYLYRTSVVGAKIHQRVCRELGFAAGALQVCDHLPET
jgi:hypothetical protein